MQRVEVRVDRLRRYGSDAAFVVYGDLGSGTVDFDHPLTARPLRLWPDSAEQRGHALDAHVTVRHLDGVVRDGHVENTHLEGEHLYPALAVTFETPAYVFGRFQHAVKMSDGSGNVSAGVTVGITVNSAPTAPEGVERAGYDSGTDRLTLSFSPSRFVPIGG